MKKKIITGVVVLFLVFVGVYVFGKKKDNGQYKEETVSIGKVEKTIDVDAEISPKVYANISSELPVLIDEVYVSENDFVKKGQELVRLDEKSLQAQVKNAELAVERAELAEKLARRHWDDYKPEEKERIKKATEQARQVLREISAQAEKALIVSPIDGIVIKQDAQVGDVASGVLMRIIDPSTLRLEALIPEVDLAKVKVGDKAKVIFDAYPEKIISGKINSVDFGSTIDQNSTYYKAIIGMQNNENLRILDGMNANVYIVVAEKDGVSVIPRDFAKKDEQGYFVFVKGDEKEKFVKKYFTVGLIGDKNVEVVSGLSSGEKIYMSDDLK